MMDDFVVKDEGKVREFIVLKWLIVEIAEIRRVEIDVTKRVMNINVEEVSLENIKGAGQEWVQWRLKGQINKCYCRLE